MDKNIGIGTLVVLAIAIIVGLILLQPIASNVEQTTRATTGAITVLNQTIPAGALGTTVELTGQELVSVLGVNNQTSGAALPAANYTLAECVKSSNNLKGICFTRVGTPSNQGTNVSYSYYPDGYADDAGARSIAGIIILLVAVGLAVVVLAGSKFDF